eukprot:g2635.t1
MAPTLKYVALAFIVFSVAASALPPSMTGIIDKHFAGINAGTPVTKDGKPVIINPLMFCSAVNYTDPDGAYSQRIVKYMKDGSGLTDLCTATPTDPTCLAFDAVVSAFAELEASFTTGPVFANYLPTWTNAKMEAVACRAGSFDLETKTLKDKNGCNGWAVCDILTTVLTASADQANTGTCGYVAILTALSRSNPAFALSLAVELIWTGSIREFAKITASTSFTATGCDYVYSQYPGVQMVGGGSDSSCGPAAEANPDCLNYEANAKIKYEQGQVALPATPGLVWAWAQFAAPWSYNVINGDNTCSPAYFQLINANFSNYQELSTAWGTTIAQITAMCNALITTDSQVCDFIYNQQIMTALQPKMSVANITRLIQMPGLNAFDEAWVTKNPLPQETPARARKWVEDFTAAGGSRASLVLMINIPTASMANLLDACKSVKPTQGAILFIDSHVFNPGFDRNFQRRCNHFVYLSKCDTEKKEATIWTWGSYRLIPFSTLAWTSGMNGTMFGRDGAVCGYVTVNAKPTPPTPTPPTPKPSKPASNDTKKPGVVNSASAMASNLAALSFCTTLAALFKY